MYQLQADFKITWHELKSLVSSYLVALVADPCLQWSLLFPAAVKNIQKNPE